MSTEIPDLPESELNGDDDAVFDDLARRAGAALRHSAPADGVRVIAARQRRQQVLKASVVGGVAVVTLIGALVIVANRDDSDGLPPVDSSPPTFPATTTPTPTSTALLPVESLPATLPATTSPTPPATASIPVDSLPATIPAPPAAVPSLWVELEPGATAPLPPAPLPPDYGASLVWTGTELIVWGGDADDPGAAGPQDGAAFDPAAGTWREIAPSPDGVRPGVVLWTGTEMLVWGDGAPDTVSAAYDPAADTWRVIADPPVAGAVAFWIGDEAVFVRHPDADHDGFADSPSSPSFAYDPATDEWRRLADGPWGVGTGWVSGGSTFAVWTGTTIITMTDTGNVILLNGYDPAAGMWRALEGLDTVKQPVVIPGRGGAAPTVAFLPLTPGTPVELFDDRGNAIGELAGRPTELASTCYQPSGNNSCLLTSLRAVSVGGEVLFWYSDDGWAFDPEAQTWRSLSLDGRQPGWDGTEVVSAGDLLFVWSGDRDGLVYRAATPG